MKQLTLADAAWDPHTKARTTDPQTSKDAASSAGGVASEHRRTIMALVRSNPGRDWTADELAERCELDRHQIGRRLNELERGLLLERSGATRPTPNGRAAACYRLRRSGQ